MKKLFVFLLVCFSSTFMFAQSDLHYEVEAIGSSGMTMYTMISIDDVLQNVSPDNGSTTGVTEIGVFDQNGKCRYAGYPSWKKKAQRWVYGMAIQGNAGFTYSFKLYDHSIEQELALTCDEDGTIVFVADTTYASTSNPMTLHFYSSCDSCYFDIHAIPNPIQGGEVSYEGEGPYLMGTLCTLTATPNPGYTFANWMENGVIVSTEATYSFVVLGERNLVAKFMANAVAEGDIVFADANVKALCVANWDTNNDGELSYAEAAVVTNLGNAFKNNTAIQSFNELQYFVNLTTIGEQAFYGCTTLSQITIPEQVAFIGEQAFYGCTGLTQVTIPTGVYSVGSRAFWNCPALQTVYFNAFNCGSMNSVFSADGNGSAPALTRVVIGNTVTRIPDYAFCGAENIYQRLVIPASVTEIGRFAFHGCNSIVQMVIQGDNLQTIGDYAFYSCSSLRTALNLPNSMTSVGGHAFEGCTQIPSLSLGTGITSIGEAAFKNCCSGFTGDLVIPSSVASIGNDALYGWGGLSSVHYTGDVGQWCGMYFGNEYANPLCYAHNLYVNDALVTDLSIPGNVDAISNYAFYACNSLTSLNIPNSVVSIGYGAFSNCNGLSSVTIGNSVTSIGNNAFNSCYGLTAAHYAGNIDQWCGITFGNEFSNPLYYAHNLYINEALVTTLSLPENLTAIPNYIFCGCSSFMGDLVIPSSVTSIGRSAFNGCSGFTGSLIVGRNVNTIGDYAFQDCNGFTSVISENPTPSTANYNTFSGVNYSIPVHVPYNTISNYQGTSGWSRFTNYKEQYVFDLLDNDLWSDEMNWYAFELPGPNDVVCINSDCHLDMDANVKHLYVLNLNDVLTVNSGKMLTVSNGVGTQSPSQLVIADGGQLITNNAPMATVQKRVAGHGSGDGCWEAVSSPIKGGTASEAVAGGDYDLYGYDEATHYWINVENAGNGISALAPAQGYLYANVSEKTLNFAGLLHASDKEVSVPISRTSGPLAGLNLVGNPFSCEAYLLDESDGVVPYFRMSDTGDALVAVQAGTPVKPCEGVFVVCPEDRGEHAAVFTTAVPAVVGQAQDVPSALLPLQGMFVNQDALDRNNVAQAIALKEGWNWISTCIEKDAVDLLEELETALGENGEQIKSRRWLAAWDEDEEEWTGDLQSIGMTNYYTYMVKAAGVCSVILEGLASEPADYEIILAPKAWTWIGFPSAEAIEVNTALSGFQAMDGDQIKSRSKTVAWDEEEEEWSGEVTTLVPGTGYMFYSNGTEERTLTFSTGSTKHGNTGK